MKKLVLAVVLVSIVAALALPGCGRLQVRRGFFNVEPQTACQCQQVTLSWQTPTDEDELFLEASPAGSVEGLEPGPHPSEGSLDVEVCGDTLITATGRNGEATTFTQDESVEIVAGTFQRPLTFVPLCDASSFVGWGAAGFEGVSDQIVSTNVVNISDRGVSVSKGGSSVDLPEPGSSAPFNEPVTGLWNAEGALLPSEGCSVDSTGTGLLEPPNALYVSVIGQCR